MERSYIFVGLTMAALVFSGCGGDKKVEERVSEIQTNIPSQTVEQNTSIAPVATETIKKESTQTPKATESSLDGKQIFNTRCAACHGEKGEGKASYPKLAGLSKEDAIKMLKGYADGSYGKAQKAIMIGQAKGINDSEKEAVAEYISLLK